MDELVAIALTVLAAAYVLWRLARPFFKEESPEESGKLLQIEQPDD